MGLVIPPAEALKVLWQIIVQATSGTMMTLQWFRHIWRSTQASAYLCCPPACTWSYPLQKYEELLEVIPNSAKHSLVAWVNTGWLASIYLLGIIQTISSLAECYYAIQSMTCSAGAACLWTEAPIGTGTARPHGALFEL